MSVVDRGGVTRTAVNISDDHLGTFVGKEACCFGADTLACTSDDGYLAGQHAGWEVEVLVDLGETVGGSHDCRVYRSVLGSFFVQLLVLLLGFGFGFGRREGKLEGWGLIQSGVQVAG